MSEHYVSKSHESLKSARILFEADCYNSSVSRCYYAMFQMAIAALRRFGIRPPKQGEYSHAWVQATISRELIRRRKLLPQRIARFLPDGLKSRNEADYDMIEIGKKAAERALARAQEFAKEVEERLLW